MRHFSCDLCGVDLAAAGERFVVRLEVAPAHAPAGLSESDLDLDAVGAMAELLDELEDSGTHPALTPARHQAEYDLCPTCRERYLADPLGRDGRKKLRFSKN